MIFLEKLMLLEEQLVLEMNQLEKQIWNLVGSVFEHYTIAGS